MVMTIDFSRLICLFKAVAFCGLVLQSHVSCQVNSPSTEGPLIGPPPTGVQFFEVRFAYHLRPSLGVLICKSMDY